MPSDQPFLQRIDITFHTRGDNLHGDTVLNVFVKNRHTAKPRKNTTSASFGLTSYIENRLAWDEHLRIDADNSESEVNPFIAFGKN